MSYSERPQTNQLISNAIEMQRHAFDIGQMALGRAIEVPMQQSIELQKSAGQLFRNGLEMSTWFGNRSAALTREALDTYFQTVDIAAENTAQMTEQGFGRTSTIGQQSLEPPQQQFAPGAATANQQGGATTPMQGTGGYQSGSYGQMPQSLPGSQQQPQQVPVQQPPAQEPVGQPAPGPAGGMQMNQPDQRPVPQPPEQQQFGQPAPQQQFGQSVSQTAGQRFVPATESEQSRSQQPSRQPGEQRAGPSPGQKSRQVPQGRKAVAGGVAEDEPEKT